MSKILVLAEKPSVGRDLARVLGCNKNGNGFIEGNRYIVTWALGHLVTHADPEKYGASAKAWKIEELPIMPEALELVVIKQTAKQFQNVKTQLHRKDVSEIVIATDAGREGELVARWIIVKSGVHKPIKRLWISSVTDKAIKDGVAHLKDGRLYENLYQSAVARAEADWYVGINATRALTCKHNAQLSCGRVQTPTLAIIAKREEQIQNFKPREYYGIKVWANQVEWTWQEKKSKATKVFMKEQAESIIKEIKGQKAQVVEVKSVQKKMFAPELYNLTELQRDANKIFGFSAKETLSIMQKLYESHKVLTYPRTDSRYLSADIVPTIKDRLKACGVANYTKFAFQASKQIVVSKHFVDDKKVSDHHAIIPTEQFVNLSAMTDKERKIYDLVVKRFIAVLYPPYVYEQKTLLAKIGEESFIARGKTVQSLGWKEIYQRSLDEDSDSEVREQKLPQIREGDGLSVGKIELTQGKTKPPAPFTEASLLAAMENPIQYMEESNQALKQTLNEAGGLGTVATRADIIEKLFASFLLEKRGKDIFITEKGRQLLNLVPSELKSPVLTAKWEQKLSSIANGALGKATFIQDIKSYAAHVVQAIKNSEDRFRHENLTRTKCPECGKFMLEVNGKKGRMLVCQDRDCGYRKGLAKVTNARCPNCHKKLELRGEGAGQIFACVCGYREKLSTFKKRKSKESSSKVSKRDVARFMKEQAKSSETPVNNALAEALAKLKLN